MNDNPPPVMIRDVIRHVAMYYDVPIESLTGNKRLKHMARQRHIAMCLARKLTGKSLTVIASTFNRRDHTTIINAIKKVNREIPRTELLDVETHILRRCRKRRDWLILKPHHVLKVFF